MAAAAAPINARCAGGGGDCSAAPALLCCVAASGVHTARRRWQALAFGPQAASRRLALLLCPVGALPNAARVKAV